MLESSKPRPASRSQRLTRLATLTLTCALLPVVAAGSASVEMASATEGAQPASSGAYATGGHAAAKKDTRHVDKQKKKKRKQRRMDAALEVLSRDGLMGPKNEWGRNIRTAPVAADSKALVKNLATQVSSHWGGTAAFNISQYNVSFYAVKPGTARITVKFDDCQRKGYIPRELYNPTYGAHFVDVPIPDDAVPASGTDGELSVWDKSTDQLWEFWKANKQADGWHACWGGRIDNYSQSNGQFPGYTGVSASGLSIAPGVIGINEMRAGKIDHALTLSVIDAANWNLLSYPATRSDGWDPARRPDAIREGQRFRLKASVNVDKLNLTPIGRAVAVAAKKYGFIVVDRAGAVGVAGESGVYVKAATGISPWGELMAGVPSYSIMRNFPWSKLQALPVDYGKPPKA